MKRLFLGVDTSCYTTSIACVSEEGIVFERRTMLSVPFGERGLRQGDAVFQHVRNLPPLIDALFGEIDRRAVAAAAVSAKPTARDDSYMPVFLAGKLCACALSNALGAPLYETTHQAGHVRAAMLGNEAALPCGAFLSMHLSGGTTDLLLVQPNDGGIERIECVGQSGDLHAGQFVDRIGVLMGLSFPSGIEFERLALSAADRSIRIPSAVDGLNCSFSGQETQARRLLEGGADKSAVAYAVYDCMARTFSKVLGLAFGRFGCENALLSGGVSGSALLRSLLEKRLGRSLLYAREGLSGDNAVGAALLARDRFEKGR